jgi:protein TonB
MFGQWQRHLVAGLGALVGGLSLSIFMLVLNRPVEQDARKNAALEREIEIVRPPKKERPVAERKTPPKPERRPVAPRPQLATDLSALGSGVALFDASALVGVGEALLEDSGSAEDMVMTADAVDSQPKPLGSNRSPAPPPEAQRKRVSGYVTLRMVIDESGQVRDARVVESSPTGFFDAAVLEVAPSWRFEPATYRGKPVSLRVDQTIRFNLG